MSRRGHTAALKKLSRNPRCVTYNLGTGTGYSVLQVRRTNEREILTSELVGSEESLNATDRQGLRRGEQEGDTDADGASSAGGRRTGDASARRPWGAMGDGGNTGARLTYHAVDVHSYSSLARRCMPILRLRRVSSAGRRSWASSRCARTRGVGSRPIRTGSAHPDDA